MSAFTSCGCRKVSGLPAGVSTCHPTAMLWQPMSHSTPPPCCVGSQNQPSCGPPCSSADRASESGPICLWTGSSCASWVRIGFMKIWFSK